MFHRGTSRWHSDYIVGLSHGQTMFYFWTLKITLGTGAGACVGMPKILGEGTAVWPSPPRE